MDYFTVDLSVGRDRATLRCTGELDVAASGTMRDAFEMALALQPEALELDASEVSFLSAAGITTLVDIVVECRDQRIPVHFRLSKQVRGVLDMVGLWWLGLIDDGISAHEALQRALRSYADQHSDGASPGPAV